MKRGQFAADGAGAVVLGGDYRGLGIVRSLGRNGVPVCVVRNSGDIQASLSRNFFSVPLSPKILRERP